MSFIDKYIAQYREKQNKKRLLELLRETFSEETLHGPLFEDFIDDMKSDEVSASDDSEDIQYNHKKAAIVVSISSYGPTPADNERLKDVSKIVREMSLGIDSVQLTRFIKNAMFLGNSPEYLMKIYSQYTLTANFQSMRRRKNYSFDVQKFGNVVPLTMKNTEHMLRDTLIECLQVPEDRLNWGNGFVWYFRIDFDPSRVTFKTFVREMRSFCEIIDDVSLKIQCITPIQRISIDYRIEGDEQMRELVASGGMAHYPQPLTYLISIKNLWEMGKVFYSNGKDVEWDNETKEHHNYQDSKCITSEYLTVPYVASEIVKSMAQDEFYKWQIDGWKENLSNEKEIFCSVLLENIKDSSKNTAKMIKEHLHQMLDRLSDRAKRTIKVRYYMISFYVVISRSEEHPERLPFEGKYEGNIKFDGCQIKYMICDDSKYNRQYITGENTNVEKDSCIHQNHIIEATRKYNPTLMIQIEENYNKNKGLQK